MLVKKGSLVSQTWVLIPARHGSTRFPGKPLAKILEKPLIQWVYEQARQVPGLAGICVATDDARIQECVAGFGGQSVMTRSDHVSGSDRLAEAAGLLGLDKHDLVVNIQGDQPVFPPLVVSHMAALVERDCSAVMITPARRLTEIELARDPNMVKVVFNHQGRALYFSRSPLPYWRDGERPYFYKHIGIYVYRVEFLQDFVTLPPGRWEQAEKLEQLRALEYGYPIHVVETEADTVEVDTPEDLARAEEYLRGI
jgi:3-deoxy-manno-octulosonate cytidylyltransferase (CMP-KDO synthetase)